MLCMKWSLNPSIKYVSRATIQTSVIYFQEETQAFAGLVQAMYETNTVAIVRRCFGERSSPELGFLRPHIAHDHIVCWLDWRRESIASFLSFNTVHVLRQVTLWRRFTTIWFRKSRYLETKSTDWRTAEGSRSVDHHDGFDPREWRVGNKRMQKLIELVSIDLI